MSAPRTLAAGVRERPIIFGGEGVRAILAGTKTQTRRVVRGVPLSWLDDSGFAPEFVADPGNHLCPYGVPGDRLWVRESFWVVEREGQGVGYPFVVFDEEFDGNEPHKSAPLRVWPDYRLGRFGHHASIHMPQEVSRLTLEVTDVRVQRLQEISEEDAKAEGVPTRTYSDGRGFEDRRTGFRFLWEAVNGKRAPWVSNPWVWALTFRRVSE